MTTKRSPTWPTDDDRCPRSATAAFDDTPDAISGRQLPAKVAELVLG
jgi:hypothetical protein